jgi:hypothetical protein
VQVLLFGTYSINYNNYLKKKSNKFGSKKKHCIFALAFKGSFKDKIGSVVQFG